MRAQNAMHSQLTPQEALIYAMVTVAAVDRQITRVELDRINGMVRELPALRGIEDSWLSNEAQACGRILAKPDGVDDRRRDDRRRRCRPTCARRLTRWRQRWPLAILPSRTMSEIFWRCSPTRYSSIRWCGSRSTTARTRGIARPDARSVHCPLEHASFHDTSMHVAPHVRRKHWLASNRSRIRNPIFISVCDRMVVATPSTISDGGE